MTATPVTPPNPEMKGGDAGGFPKTRRFPAQENTPKQENGNAKEMDMERVEGVDLALTTAVAEAELQAERQQSVAGLVKGLLQQAANVQKDVDAIEDRLKQRKAHLLKITAKVDKLRAGDWKALPDPQKGEAKEAI